MKISRLYTGDDGKSHWDDIELKMDSPYRFAETQPAPPSGAMRSELETANVQFSRIPPNSDSGWRNAPNRRYIVILTGVTELEVADGAKRILGAGSVILAEDLTGQGHRGRSGPEPLDLMIVPLVD